MEIRNVVVAGSGTMGAGIAQVCVAAGYKTLLYDLNQDLLEKAKLSIEKGLNKSVELGKMSAEQCTHSLQLLSISTDISTLIGDLIIEAIPENPAIKHAFFQQVASQNKPDCILASNTSSIPITQIAAAIPYPERVVGIHFFNPAPVMKLVEIIEGEAGDPTVADKADTFVKSLGKQTIRAKDAPGFIVNRVARHYYVEALKIAEEGVASVADIDLLMESAGFKMGPFRLMDLIGVDTNYAVTESMFTLFNYENRFRPNRIQKQKVLAGHHGRKTGKGFYTYEKK